MHSLIPLSDEAHKTLKYEWFAVVFLLFNRIYYCYYYDIFSSLY